MKAILSDIHGNLEALQAVLRDIARHEVEAVYCLGDLVGYGPNPRECVDLAMQWPVVLLGNFDAWLMADSQDLLPAIVRYLSWSRVQLDAPVPTPEAADRRRAFLDGLPQSHRESDFLFVHGSPRNPLHEDVFPEDIYCPGKMEAIFSLAGRCCFVGHTHVPGIFTEGPQYYSLEELNRFYRLNGRRTLCNVGSVGQPRDGDWRACYALVDGDTVSFRRVEYDVETTIRKVYAIDELDNLQGDRLREGR